MGRSREKEPEAARDDGDKAVTTHSSSLGFFAALAPKQTTMASRISVPSITILPEPRAHPPRPKSGDIHAGATKHSGLRALPHIASQASEEKALPNTAPPPPPPQISSFSSPRPKPGTSPPRGQSRRPDLNFWPWGPCRGTSKVGKPSRRDRGGGPLPICNVRSDFCTYSLSFGFHTFFLFRHLDSSFLNAASFTQGTLEPALFNSHILLLHFVFLSVVRFAAPYMHLHISRTSSSEALSSQY